MSHLSQLVRGAAVCATLALSAPLAGAQAPAPAAGELLAITIPNAASADSADSAAPTAAAPTLAPVGESAAPTLAATAVGVRSRAVAPASAQERQAAATRAARSGFSQSQVLMIVGGAAFLTGAIIGDDAGTVVMLGGAAVGLYGLYQYLQSN